MIEKAKDQFLDMLENVCSRPGMYIAKPSLRLIATYMDGYNHALEDNGIGRVSDGFSAWIFLKYDIYSPAWHWTRVLHHAFGTEQAAISQLPTLVREFLAELDKRGGTEWFAMELKKRYPIFGREPDSTFTKIS